MKKTISKSKLTEVVKRAISEANKNEAELFAEQIQSAIEATFPNSFVNVRYSDNLEHSVAISFTVTPKGKYISNIAQNDICPFSAQIWGVSKDGKLADILEFDPNRGGGSILVNPKPDSFLAYDTVKVGLRKKKGSPEKILKHIDNYFKKLKKTIVANWHNIPERHQETIKDSI